MAKSIEETNRDTQNSIDFQKGVQEYKTAKSNPEISKEELKSMELSLKKLAKTFGKQWYLDAFKRLFE